MANGRYMLNEAGDGYKPCCAKCGKPFPDAEVGDVKNYPDDGLIMAFFTCEQCGEESKFTYEPYQPENELMAEGHS